MTPSSPWRKCVSLSRQVKWLCASIRRVRARLFPRAASALDPYSFCEDATGKRRFEAILDGRLDLGGLYDFPKNSRLVYAESGGLHNADIFSCDTAIIIPVFPWSETETEKNIGPVARLEKLVKDGRVLPVIQHPPLYEGHSHLKFLLDRGTPSFLHRGPYAYAALRGMKSPKLETRSEANISIANLKEILALQDHCKREHASWLAITSSKPSFAEYRYKGNPVYSGSQAYSSTSILYRYATVAFYLGSDVTDKIICTFSPDLSSAILLQLHVLIDHVICHGLCSDFVVHATKQQDELHFFSPERSVTRLQEFDIERELTVCLLPQGGHDSDWPKEATDQHFLKDFDFAKLKPGNVAYWRALLRKQVDQYNSVVESRGRKTGQRPKRVRLGLRVYLSPDDPLQQARPQEAVDHEIEGKSVPWLFKKLSEVWATIHCRRRLGSYTIHGAP